MNNWRFKTWNFKCMKELPGYLKVGKEYEVSYNDPISFKVKAENKEIWVMTSNDIIEYFRKML